MGDEILRLRFAHKHNPTKRGFKPIPSSLAPSGKVRAITDAFIERLDGKELELVSTGTALCSIYDRFDRESGRRLALARACKDMPYARRKSIWKAYLTRSLVGE